MYGYVYMYMDNCRILYTFQVYCYAKYIETYYMLYIDPNCCAFPFFHWRPQVLMFLLALFVLMFHCFIKPYKKETSNVVETLLLLNLVLVAAAYLKAPHGQAGSVFVVILTVLPYLYAVGFLIWAAGKKMLGNYINHKCIPNVGISYVVHVAEA